MTAVITDIHQITSDWLTQTLRSEGYLKRGHIIDFDITATGETSSAQYAHLNVKYADGSTPCPSAYLFFKHTKPDRNTERICISNRTEAQFFQTVASDLNLPVVPCYHIGHTSDWKQAHFLMADMSPTHWTLTDLPDPSADHILQGRVDALAKLHAYWWEHPKLGREIGTAWTSALFQKQQERVIERLSRFQTVAGHNLSQNRLKTPQLLLTSSSWNLLNSTLESMQNVTLTHGDPHGPAFNHRPDQVEPGTPTVSTRHNCGFNGAKGSVYEGGIRVPMIIRWPDGFEGGREIKDLIHFTDWLPTLLGICEIERPAGLPLDGLNILPILQGETPNEAPRRFWQLSPYSPPIGHCNAAMRDGPWKLVRPRLNIPFATPEGQDLAKRYVEMDIEYKYNPDNVTFMRDPIPERIIPDPEAPELFNIDNDPLEKNNIATDHPNRVSRMLTELETWFEEVEIERQAIPPAW